ncbi:MAG: magnesium chelatase domain-containing protein, partial [Oscillospiraceae bacterium]
MFAMVDSLGVSGLDGFMVRVETDISGGLPNFDIVGLPDNAVKEAKERVRSAIKNSGFTYPVSRITVNLAPADVRKTGAVYDLPVFLSVLCATEQLKLPLEKLCFAGELGLNGEIRTVNGILPMAISAKENGFDGFFVPEENAAEAAIVEGLTVYPCKNVLQVVAHFKT